MKGEAEFGPWKPTTKHPRAQAMKEPMGVILAIDLPFFGRLPGKHQNNSDTLLLRVDATKRHPKEFLVVLSSAILDDRKVGLSVAGKAADRPMQPASGQRNRLLEVVIGFPMLLMLGIAGNSQAQIACPGPPRTTLSSVNYDPFSTSDTVETFRIEGGPRNNNPFGAGRSLAIWKQPYGSESEGVPYYVDTGGQGNLEVFIPPHRRNLSHLGIAGGWRDTIAGFNSFSQSISYRLPNGATPFSTARLVIPKNQNLAPGQRTIRYASYAWYEELYQSGGTCNSYFGSVAFLEQSFALNVASSMALSLAGGSTTGTLDFGNNLATAAKQSVNLRLRSNTPYRVTMDSTHNGVLKLNNSPTATDQIAYSATLNGTSITEAAPFINTNPTGTGGGDVTLPFEITIGDTSNARAGFYKDIITLTIASGI